MNDFNLEKGLAIFIALMVFGLVGAALSWATAKIDTWTANSKTAPLAIGLTFWSFLLAAVVVAFVLGVRWLPSLST